MQLNLVLPKKANYCCPATIYAAMLPNLEATKRFVKGHATFVKMTVVRGLTE